MRPFLCTGVVSSKLAQPLTQRKKIKLRAFVEQSSICYRKHKRSGKLVSLPGRNQKNVFRGERGPLPPHFGTIIFNQPEKGVGVWAPKTFGPTTESYCQHAAKRRKTLQNAEKHRNTPKNAPTRRKTPHNAAKRRKMLQNTAKRRKMLQNAAKCRKTIKKEPANDHLIATPQKNYATVSAGKRRKTPENAGKHRKTPGNAGKCRKMPQNAAKGPKCCKTPQIQYRELTINLRGTKYLGG